jgi:hypothetical protein
MTVPFHLASREFFSAVSERLRPGGVVAININTLKDDSWLASSIGRTLGTVFPQVYQLEEPVSCNIIFLGSQAEIAFSAAGSATLHDIILARTLEPAEVTGGLVLTDDRAPTDWLGILALLRSSSDQRCGEERVV